MQNLINNLFGFITDNLVLSSLFGVTLLGLLMNEWLQQKFGVSGVEPNQAVQLINYEKAVLIDIRQTTDFSKGHIVGSINIPLPELTHKVEQLKGQYPKVPLIVVCNLGRSAIQASNSLEKAGLTSYYLAGGVQAWQQANLPLVNT